MANAKLETVENFSSPWEERLFRQSRNPRKTNSELKFTLIFPATDQAPTLRREFLLHTPSEGVSYILTVARDAGWDVEMIDLRADDDAEKAAKRAALRGGVLAMPTFVDSVPQNKTILKRARELNPDLKIIVGGALVSSLPGPILRACEADFAVLQEGELSFLELLDHIEHQRSPEEARQIAGIALKNADGTVIQTNPRPQIKTLDSVPIPDLMLYPSIKAHPTIAEMGLTTARGCYARCTFCYVNIPKMGFKSVARVREELTQLKALHGTNYLYINDLTFTADMKRTWHLCDVLGELGIEWSCSTRVEKCEPKLLAHMKNTGCKEIWYGVESLDNEILKITNKKQTVDQIMKAIDMTLESGILVMANLIVGLPGESEESLQKMFDFVENSPVVPASIKYLTPFPGTPIYQEAFKRGLIGDDHIGYLERLAKRKVNDQNDELFNMTELSDDKLREAFKYLTEVKNRRVKELLAPSDQNSNEGKLARTDSLQY